MSGVLTVTPPPYIPSTGTTTYTIGLLVTEPDEAASTLVSGDLIINDVGGSLFYTDVVLTSGNPDFNPIDFNPPESFTTHFADTVAGDTMSLLLTVESSDLKVGSYVTLYTWFRVSGATYEYFNNVIVSDTGGELTIEKKITPNPTTPGGTFTSNVIVHNTFEVPIEVKLRDIIPEGTEIVSTSFSPTSQTPDSVDWIATVSPGDTSFQIVNQITDGKQEPGVEYTNIAQLFLDEWTILQTEISATVITQLPTPDVISSAVVSEKVSQFGLQISGDNLLTVSTQPLLTQAVLTQQSVNAVSSIELKALHYSDKKSEDNVKQEIKQETKQEAKQEHKKESKKKKKKTQDDKKCHNKHKAKSACQELITTNDDNGKATTKFCASVILFNNGPNNAEGLTSFKLFLESGLFNSRNTCLSSSDAKNYKTEIINDKSDGFIIVEITVPFLSVGQSATFNILAELSNRALKKYDCFITTVFMEPDSLASLKTRVRELKYKV